ncbi:MAG: tetratricopeptide repeat protein [Vulcanimicrobiota bacterium]
MGDVYVGRYKVIEELGRGGMGIVYRGIDPLLDRPVAIKVLPPKKTRNKKAVDRFLREARLSAKLDHPNIIKIHDIGVEEDIYHIVMEYVNGSTLRELIEERSEIKDIDINYMAEIFLDILEAMAYAHSKKIVHRDIKPDNIMLTRDGRVKVMDFGLAVLENRHSLTEIGQVMGTVAYFSPEQARGDMADSRSDIYSLGAIFYEMLTNYLVFQATNPGQMIAHVLNTPAPDPVKRNPKIPNLFSKIILRCLEKVPEKRYQDALDMLDEIENWLSQQKIANLHLSKIAIPDATPPEKEKTTPVKPTPGQARSLADRIASAFGVNKSDDEYQQEPEEPYQVQTSFAPETPAPKPTGEKPPRDYFSSFVRQKQEEKEKRQAQKGFRSSFAPSSSSISRHINVTPNANQVREVEKTVNWQDTPYGGGFARDDVPMGGSFARPGTEKKTEVSNKTYQKPVQNNNVVQIPVKPSPKKLPAKLDNDKPVASTQWMKEAEEEKKWGRYRYVLDRIKKDEAAVDQAGVSDTPIACPRCGAENEPSRKYCYQCGNRISKSKFLTHKEALEHYDKGNQLLKDSRIEEALKEYEQAVKKDPKLADAFMKLGRIRSELGLNSQAREAYKTASTLMEKDPQPHILIADSYRLEEKYDEAIIEYIEASKLAPEDIQIRNQLALLYSQNDNFYRAIEEYLGILSIDPQNVEAHRQLGYLYMSMEKFEEAIRQFEWVLDYNPDDEEVYRVLGNLYVKTGQLGHAEEIFNTVLEVKPEDPEAIVSLGEIYEKQDRVDQALNHLDQAVKSNATNVEARKKLADLYTRMNRTDLATHELETAVQFTPEDPELHKTLGDLYIKTNRVDRALEHFEKIVNSQQTSAELHHKLASIYQTKDYSDLSIKEFHKATKLEPYNPTYREDLAMAYYAQNKYNEAIAEMRKAATLDSTNPDYHKALGVMLEETDRLDDAEKEFQKVIQSNPSDALAQGMLGRVYAKKGLLSMAVFQYKKALELNPNSHMFNVYLGKALTKMGKLNEAARVFSRAIEKTPSGSSARKTKIISKAYANLGRVYVEQGEYNKALDVLQSAYKNNPNDPLTLLYLGMLFNKRKKFEKSFDYLNRASKLSPNDPDIMRELALAYRGKGNIMLAVSMVKKAIFQFPQMESYEVMAELMEQLGDKDGAQEIMDEALENCPRSQDYIYWLKGGMAARNSNWNEAATFYEQAIEENNTEWYYFKDLSVVLEQLGNFDQALAYLNMALECEPEKHIVDKIYLDINRLRRKMGL